MSEFEPQLPRETDPDVRKGDPVVLRPGKLTPGKGEVPGPSQSPEGKAPEVDSLDEDEMEDEFGERIMRSIAERRRQRGYDPELDGEDEDEDPLAGDVDTFVHPDETRTDEQIAFDERYAVPSYDDWDDGIIDEEEEEEGDDLDLEL